MRSFLKLTGGLLLIFLLTGCIGEDYDFTPPTVTLESPTTLQPVELVEANLDWRGENGEQLKKETKDIQSFAKEQKQLHFNSGQQVDLRFDSEDFAVETLTVSIWKNAEELTLELNDDRSFYLPKEKGDYVIVVDLHTDLGKAQYTGNIIIQE